MQRTLIDCPTPTVHNVYMQQRQKGVHDRHSSLTTVQATRHNPIENTNYSFFPTALGALATPNTPDK